MPIGSGTIAALAATTLAVCSQPVCEMLMRPRERKMHAATDGAGSGACTPCRAADSFDESVSEDPKYRSFFENAVEGIFQSTPEGRYLSCNPALARMYGYATPESLMRAVGNIQQDVYVDPAVRDAFKERIARDGRVTGLEYQIRRKDNTVIWICEHARAVHAPDGRLLYYEGTVQDITRRKEAEAAKAKLEAQLLQAQKMEAIGTLAGGIAHDFNNILGAIQGFTEMAQDDTAQNSAASQHLNEVLIAVRRAKELVKQILAFSRQTDTERSPLRLSVLMAEVLRLMNATLPSTIRCRSHLQTQSDWVMANATQLHQVLVNLCANAGYAMRENGGTLDLMLDLVLLRAGGAASLPQMPPGKYLRLCVSDTGCGMKPEVAARIFEPFFTTKPPGEGTGLGLSVAHGIVKNHGGCITVESVVGHGSIFQLYLPSVENSLEPNVTRQQPVRGSERVLFVDDEDALIQIAQNKLRRLGYKLTTRSDSLEALRTFEKDPHAFDIVVTDQTMPNLLGTDLCREIRRHRPDIPVVICSGQLDACNQAILTTSHCTEFLPKPLDFAALSRVIQRFAQHENP
jgi:PAS domain S-box-containing protein